MICSLFFCFFFFYQYKHPTNSYISDSNRQRRDLDRALITSFTLTVASLKDRLFLMR